MIRKINEAAERLLSIIGEKPTVGVILGSGLGDYAAGLPGSISVKYSDIPHLAESTVPGHAGEFIAATAGDKRVLFMRGRFHPYEGHEPEAVTMPVRIMARLGVTQLIVTNAAGGVNTSFKPGDLMLIDDHINFGTNPLRGKNLDGLGPRFPDMSQAYDAKLRETARNVAQEQGIELKHGVYFYMNGPSFETPAEIRALRILGADAVGMSTVAEVIAARHAGVKVLGLSCISNMAAGILDQPLSHNEVMETGERVRDTFAKLLGGILRAI